MVRQDKKGLRLVLAANIKLKMKLLGIKTNNDLRKLTVQSGAGISQSMISTILTAKTSPRVDTVQRIADALNCSASDLFQEDPDDIPAMKDQDFLALYAKYQLASERDRDLVKRLLWD